MSLTEGVFPPEYLSPVSYSTAITALGGLAEQHGNFASAMFADLEQNEAMLIAQMTATHVVMTNLGPVRDKLEVSVELSPYGND
ncbi:MAG: hypothetical protein ABJD13_08070 [Paracoccaceae bacterium]